MVFELDLSNGDYMLYDKDIRDPLFDFFDEYYGKIRIFEEKQIGKSRADAVMILDGCLVGIEIKSDADTYSRLDRQVADYNKHFDYNYVVVGTKHANHIEEHVPDWWGIITVDEVDSTADFYMLRTPKINPRVHWTFLRKRQISFLWRMELANILKKHSMPKYPGKSKKFVQDYLFDNIEEEELKKDITDELFERDYTTVAERIEEYKKTKLKTDIVKVRKVKRRRRKNVHI